MTAVVGAGFAVLALAVGLGAGCATARRPALLINPATATARLPSSAPEKAAALPPPDRQSDREHVERRFGLEEAKQRREADARKRDEAKRKAREDGRKIDVSGDPTRSKP